MATTTTPSRSSGRLRGGVASSSSRKSKKASPQSASSSSSLGRRRKSHDDDDIDVDDTAGMTSSANVDVPPAVLKMPIVRGGDSTVRYYYASCSLIHPLSQLTTLGDHISSVRSIPPSSFPKWELCVGDVVAVHCDESTPPDVFGRDIKEDEIGKGGGGGRGGVVGSSMVGPSHCWRPYRVPWSHCQVTAIYRDADVTDDDFQENDEARTKTKATTTSSVMSSSVSASTVMFEIRWFPRISEARLAVKSMSKDGGGRKNANAEGLLRCLGGMINKYNEKETNAWEEGGGEVILEGKQRSIIQVGSLLGPIDVDDDDKSATGDDAHASLLPRNRRTISEVLACDENGMPYFIEGASVKGRDRLDPSSRVERGVRGSRSYNRKGQAKTIIDVVMRIREERYRRMTTSDTSRMSSFDVADGTTVGMETPGGNLHHEKRHLFGDNYVEKDDLKGKKRPKLAHENSWADGNADGDVRLHDESVEDGSSAVLANDSVIDIEKRRIRCDTDPFHVDVSALKSFYEVMDILPPVDSYDARLITGVGGGSDREGKVGTSWRVKLGDTVAIEVEQESSKCNSGLGHYPFVVSWAPCEVITIYRLHRTKSSCTRLREVVSERDQRGGRVDGGTISQRTTTDNSEVMIEIRWLYRPWEIPGASKRKVESIAGRLDEVFETDQVDVCSADSILSPVQLHDATMSPAVIPRIVSGMPLVHYHCSRFWSIHRSSFVPSGSLSTRVSRGRMHSAYKAAFRMLERPSVAGITISSGNKPWKEEFQVAIQKLSLAEAAQDAQENGMVLSCRETERAQIMSFLRKAISGLVQSNSNDGGEEEEVKNLKSSLFIAGPPGTGKTASVRSIIAELQTEQYKGLLPEFNFIALNGMELRHPFDAYVKLWEAISGTRKERLSAGDAVYELENYFCGDLQKGGISHSDSEDEFSQDDNNGDISEPPVTVLMLDEIDYLITKKETLVYNFFDWPLRATTARLVVVGISNTINLPEKLSTRVQSRIGGERCHFRSYNVEDTATILKTRLGMLGDSRDNPVFEEDAIKFAARKTANLSGDIRKAFHMCKLAAETVFEEYSSGKRQLAQGRPIVRIHDVQKGSRDMFTSIVLKAVSCSTDYEALLLIALGALKRGQDDRSFQVKEILTKIESIANASGEPRYMDARLSLSDVLGIVNRLGDAGVIQLNTYMTSPFPYISTHLHSYEILASYRDTRHSKLAEKHLANQRLF